jgi:membrane-bound serine protease (ClpP class)
MFFSGFFNTVDSFLFDPNVTFLLFMVAMLGIYMEIAHPGAILPGSIGAIALIFFLFSLSSFPVNWTGFALMMLAFVLLVLDVRLFSHGISTAGALVALIIGSLLFFNSGGTRVSPLLVYLMAGVMGILSFTLVAFVVRARHRAVTTGVEGMIGAEVVSLTPLTPEGRVSFGGENWAAVLEGDTAVEANTKLQIVAVDGLLLHVQPLQQPKQVEDYAHSSFE